MDQDLHIKRRGKQTRLITHMLFYMDDIIIFSGNKKHLQLAVEKIIEYFQTDLGLKIKPKWNVNKVQYTDKNNDKHGVFIDMMGFKIYREGVAIRKTISIKISRKMRRVRKKIKNHQRIYPKEAFQVSSYNGWVKNTNSKYFYYHYEMWLCLPICKEVISSNMRSMYYQNFNKKYELINQKGDYYGEKLQGIYNS
jgi:hypothetical protein